MKKQKFLPTMLSIVFALACLNASVLGQTNDDKNKFAAITGGGSSVRWHVAAPHASVTLTVSAPDGQVFRKEFQSGVSPEFTLVDNEGNRLADGQYNYELRLTPEISSAVKKELKAARAKGGADDAAAERSLRRRGLLPSQSLIQSGSFTILRGAVIVSGGVEPGSQRASGNTSKRGFVAARSKQSEASPLKDGAIVFASHANDPDPPRISWKTNSTLPFPEPLMPDQVIPDDLIVQASLCVGFDCVNNESFGTDTIRLKENNTRIKFEDTSTSAGYASNDWQLTANDQPSGGANKFSIDDITGAKTPFTITAGAATNSIFVDSVGKVGFRTSTPVLDLHTTTSNTPAIRLEQTNAGGFTAQTWDIGANEANFFVRDVTGGSLLPFRIRPGAPTSTLDISANGDVGIDTTSPDLRLEVHADAAALPATSGTTQTGIVRLSQGSGVGVMDMGFGGTNGVGWIQVVDSTNLSIEYGLSLNPNGGNVGIGTTTPTETLSVNGTASKTGGGSWATFSDERLKNIKGRFNSGLAALMQLQPLRYEYKPNNALNLNSKGEHIGFGAQALQKVIPEAVTKTAEGYLLVNNDPIIWTMLNAIKEQQKEIEQLKAQIQQLKPRASRGARNRRR